MKTVFSLKPQGVATKQELWLMTLVRLNAEISESLLWLSWDPLATRRTSWPHVKTPRLHRQTLWATGKDYCLQSKIII